MAAVNEGLTGGPGTDALTARDTFGGTVTGRYQGETIDHAIVQRWQDDAQALPPAQRQGVVARLIRDIRDGHLAGAPNLTTIAAVADALSEARA